MQKHTLRQPVVTKFTSEVRARPASHGAHVRSRPGHLHRGPGAAAIGRLLLHPAVTALPLAFLAGTFGTDLGLWLTGDPFWARASLWLTGLGLVTGLLSEIPVWIEFQASDQKFIDLHDWRNWIDALAGTVMMALALISRSEERRVGKE